MSYVQRNVVGDDEKLIGVAHIHWFYIVKGALWLILPVLLWLWTDRQLSEFIFAVLSPAFYEPVAVMLNYIFGALTLIGLFVFLFSLVTQLSTEVGLTTRRVIYKRGLVFVDVIELDLEEIKAANLDHGMLGRFMNYADVFLDSRFVENMDMPMVAHSYAFIKRLNKMREHLKQDSMHLVLEDRWHSGQEEIVTEVKDRLDDAADQLGHAGKDRKSGQGDNEPSKTRKSKRDSREVPKDESDLDPAPRYKRFLHDKILKRFRRSS